MFLLYSKIFSTIILLNYAIITKVVELLSYYKLENADETVRLVLSQSEQSSSFGLSWNNRELKVTTFKVQGYQAFGCEQSLGRSPNSAWLRVSDQSKLQ